MIRFKTEGVCAKEIMLEVENGVIKEVSFSSGCPGNLIGISRLIKGMPAEQVIENLKGTDCAGRGTSCPDQLAKALELYLEKQ